MLFFGPKVAHIKPRKNAYFELFFHFLLSVLREVLFVNCFVLILLYHLYSVCIPRFVWPDKYLSMSAHKKTRWNGIHLGGGSKVIFCRGLVLFLLFYQVELIIVQILSAISAKSAK